MILNVISQTLFPISFILIIAPAPPSRDYPLLLSCNIIYIYISLSSNFFCIDQRPPIYIWLVRIVSSNPLGLSWRLTMRKKKKSEKVGEEEEEEKNMGRFWLQDEACIRERDGQEGLCDSKACEEASKRMVAFMRKGMDPCKDFYQFACGGIRDQQPYQPSSSFNMLQAKVDDHLHSEWTHSPLLPPFFFFFFFFH